MPARGSKSFLNKALDNGAETHRSGINGLKVNSKLEPVTETGYDRIQVMWEEFCSYKGKDPVASAYDLESLKEFMHYVAYGIEGKYNDDVAGQGSVMQVWKRFTANFKRNHDAIPGHITLSVTNFLEQIVFPKRGCQKIKRKRKHARKNHFFNVGRHLWGGDWHEYKLPIMRVSTWAELLLYAFSSARVCEYLEGVSRKNSGRGLYCRDITFGVIRNELGEPELAIQVVKDAKGMSDSPEKRPEHELYEGLSTRPRPLLVNPMFPILAMFIAGERLRDYHTADQVLKIRAPPQDEVYVLEWRDPECPLFEGLDGKIQTAAAFSKILRELVVRSGYPDGLTVHDLRAEGLFAINKLYSEAQRMVHAGHRNPTTYSLYYAPNNGTDGQAAYLGDDVRTHVSDLFRGLSLRRKPDLYQTLPAEKRYQLENREDYLRIETALSNLKGSSDAVQKKRQALYNEKRKLVGTELRKCQKAQAHRAPHEETEDTYALGPHRSRFSRACRMMPARQRLAANILQVATFRSELGRQVLDDMITLCRQEREIEVRLGLEDDKCHCENQDRSSKDGKCKRVTGHELGPQSWKHIYQCHKAYLQNTNDFAEFCFRCDQWFVKESNWEQHCLSHLQSPDRMVQCDPLIFGGTLVEPGCCPVCQHDPELLPSKRMYQFLNRITWKDHISRCLEVWVKKQLQIPGVNGLISCPHPHPKCAALSVTDLELRFHLEDIHGLEFAKKRKVQADMEMDLNSSKKRRCVQKFNSLSLVSSPSRDYVFVNETEKFVSSPQKRSLDVGVRGCFSNYEGMQPLADSDSTLSADSWWAAGEDLESQTTASFPQAEWEDNFGPSDLDCPVDPNL